MTGDLHPLLGYKFGLCPQHRTSPVGVPSEHMHLVIDCKSQFALEEHRGRNLEDSRGRWGIPYGSLRQLEYMLRDKAVSRKKLGDRGFLGLIANVCSEASTVGAASLI